MSDNGTATTVIGARAQSGPTGANNHNVAVRSAPAPTTSAPVRDPSPPKKFISPKPRKSRKTGPKNYSVNLSHGNFSSSSTIQKSTPRSATASHVRSAIRHLPHSEDINVWTRSSKRYHPWKVRRTSTNPKHRSFSLTRNGASLTYKQALAENSGVPDSFLHSPRQPSPADQADKLP